MVAPRRAERTTWKREEWIKHSIKVTFGRMLETVVFVLFVSNEGLTKEFIFVRVVQATMPLSGERCPL